MQQQTQRRARPDRAGAGSTHARPARCQEQRPGRRPVRRPWLARVAPSRTAHLQACRRMRIGWTTGCSRLHRQPAQASHRRDVTWLVCRRACLPRACRTTGCIQMRKKRMPMTAMIRCRIGNWTWRPIRNCCPAICEPHVHRMIGKRCLGGFPPVWPARLTCGNIRRLPRLRKPRQRERQVRYQAPTCQPPAAEAARA